MCRDLYMYMLPWDHLSIASRIEDPPAGGEGSHRGTANGREFSDSNWTESHRIGRRTELGSARRVRKSGRAVWTSAIHSVESDGSDSLSSVTVFTQSTSSKLRHAVDRACVSSCAGFCVTGGIILLSFNAITPFPSTARAAFHVEVASRWPPHLPHQLWLPRLPEQLSKWLVARPPRTWRQDGRCLATPS